MIKPKKFLILFSTLFLLPKLALFAHGVSAADEQSMIVGGYLQYIWLGASHMLTGYDHLLFLFGVIFFLTKEDTEKTLAYSKITKS